MKKITTLIIAAIMVATLAVAAFAGGYTPAEEPCGIDFQVKKANPANVIKDGVIGEGEYERYVHTDEFFNDREKSHLAMHWGLEEYWEHAETMLTTTEYYFSWDEVHGFNLAAKWNPGEGNYQNCKTPEPDEEGRLCDEEFMCQVGLCFSAGYNPETDQSWFYYSVSKNKETGEQVVGHWNQLGYTGTYSATMGTDYVMNYLDDGSVLVEWSIPLASIVPEGANGFEFCMATTAGIPTYNEDGTWAGVHESATWCVNFGQGAFLCQKYDYNEPARATFSDEVLAGPVDTTPVTTAPAGDDTTGGATTGTATTPDSTTAGTTTPGSTDATTTPGSTTAGTTTPGSTTAGGTTTTTPGTTTKPGTAGGTTAGTTAGGTTAGTAGNKVPATQTGDPMVIAAVVAAISAAGVVVSKKRR